MSLEMGGVDHQSPGFGFFSRQLGEYFVEDAHPTPADEPVIDSLMGTIFPWSVTPPQTILDDEDDPLITKGSSTRATPCESGK